MTRFVALILSVAFMALCLSCSPNSKNDEEHKILVAPPQSNGVAQPGETISEPISLSLEVTNLPTGEKIYLFGRDKFPILEGKADSFSEMWAADMLERHPEIRRALEDVREVPNSGNFGSEDVVSIAKMMTTIPSLNGFVPLDLGAAEFVRYRRFVTVVLLGKIKDDRMNAYFIRIPGGKWLFIEAKRMPY